MGWHKEWSEETIRSEVWHTDIPFRIWSRLKILGGRDGADGVIYSFDNHEGIPLESLAKTCFLSPKDFKEGMEWLINEKMVKVDDKGFITVCKWKHYQNEYKRQSPYRSSYKSGYKPSYSLGAGLDDTEYTLYLISLYKITEEQYKKEKIKMEAWLSLPQNRHRTMNRKFIVNWLNKCDFALPPPKSPFDFKVIFNQYPEHKRINETDCLNIFNASVRTDKDFRDIQNALKNYLGYEKQNKTEPSFYKKAPTWFAEWRDWMPSA